MTPERTSTRAIAGALKSTGEDSDVQEHIAPVAHPPTTERRKDFSVTRSKPTALLCSLLLAVMLTGCLPSSRGTAGGGGSGHGHPPRPTTTTTTRPPTTTTSTTTTAPPPSSTTTTTAPPVEPGGFVHPGILIGQADINFVRAKVAANQEPWKSAINRMLTSGSSTPTATRPTYRYSSLSYPPAPVAVIQAPGAGNKAYIAAHPELGFATIGDLEHLDDARAAYTHALLWAYTGNQANANKAIEIMNAWSSRLTEIKFDQPRRPDNGSQVYDNGKLQAGWGGALMARAGEIVRYTGAGWATNDVTRFATMLHNVYLPIVITGWNTGPNWMMTFAEATMSIGVFTNDRAAFDTGVATWRLKTPTTVYVPSDGSRPIAPTEYWNSDARINELWYRPTSYPSGLQGETCRDLSHMAMGLGAMANGAQTAKLQGVDLYGAERTRMMAGFERNAGYVNEYLDKVASLGGAQPPATWRPTGWVCANFLTAGEGYLSGWEVAYAHYATTLGLSMPQTKRLVERARPTGPGLHMSWETLTSAR